MGCERAGIAAAASDPLTAKAVALGPTFAWISHTWDHADMTGMSYATAYSEFSQNDQTIRGLGLTPYAVAEPGDAGDHGARQRRA